MNGALGDILYIVFMIAIVVLSMYKQTKRSQKPDIAVPDHEKDKHPIESFPPLDDWLNDGPFAGNEKLKPDELKTSPLRVEKLEPEKLQYTSLKRHRIQKKERIKKPELTSKLSYKKFRVGLGKEESIKEPSYWDDESFDLQKAIIFSEIIKRPNF